MDVMTICKQQLTHLSTATIMGRRAPHKAVLLLAIMDLIEDGSITSSTVVLTLQLEKAFEAEWKRFIGSPLVFKCKVATPYWHMQNEPFYTLCFNNGKTAQSFNNTYSVKNLRENTFAILDPDLFSLMNNKNSRTELRNVLINTYLLNLNSDLHYQNQQSFQ